MTGKKSISIKYFLRISLAVMLLFLFIISALYSLFIYTFSKDQFESSFQTFSESIEAQLDSQFHNSPIFPTCKRFFSVKNLLYISTTSPAATNFGVI